MSTEEKPNALLGKLTTPVDAISPADPLADPLEADTLEWAKDVMWLRNNLNATKAQAKKWSGFRFALWEYAKLNTADYVSQMLPKATQIIERAKAKAPDASVVDEAETKSIAEIRKILDAAIKEAASVE